MAKVYKTTFLFKRGTKAQWEEQNIVLQKGEPGFATDANLMKIGDGVTPWNDLEPINSEEYVVNRPTHFDFPSVGKSNVIYKAHEEAKLYQWNTETSQYEPLESEFILDDLNINDDKSIVVEDSKLSLRGFNAAQAGQIPQKGIDGSLTWYTPVTAEDMATVETQIEELNATVEEHIAAVSTLETTTQQLDGRISTLEQDVPTLATKEEVAMSVGELQTLIEKAKQEAIQEAANAIEVVEF